MACCGINRMSERDKALARQMKKDYDEARRERKLLLLGPGESGKSTVLKQMQLLHGAGFSAEDRETYKGELYVFLLHTTCKLVSGLREHNLPLDSEPEEMAANYFDYAEISDVADYEDHKKLFGDPKMWDCIEMLWKSRAIQQIWKNRHLFQINEAYAFFADRIQIVSKPDHILTDEEILRIRKRTTGIVEQHFEVKNVPFMVIDVGGQRSARRKWIHYFGEVTAIVYLLATSEFDQMLAEDTTQNRLSDAILLFKTIWDNRWLSNVSVIAFMNKIDLLEEKIDRVNKKFSKYFPNFVDLDNRGSAAVLEYIEQALQQIATAGSGTGKNASSHKQLYIHHTVATDTKVMEKVLDSATDIVIKFHLAKTNLI
eukprot:Clim_evm37s44 gene=Clim_evmTU37s44